MADATSRAEAAQAELASLAAAGPIPDREAVAAARRHRDEFWRLIARLAFGGTPPTEAELAAFAGPQSPALAFERAVHSADTLADRRADESGLVADAARATQLAAATAQALHQASQAQAAGKTQAEAALAAWQTLLPPNLQAPNLGAPNLQLAGLPPAARLDELNAFTAARLRVLDRLEALEVEQAAGQTLAAQHAAWCDRLRHHLPDAPAAPLPQVLIQADRQVQAAAEATRQRDAHTATLNALRRQLKEATANRQAAATDHAAWRADWQATLSALGRPPDEAPAATEDVLQELDQLGRDLAEQGSIAARLDGMRQDNAAFTHAVAARLGAADSTAAALAAIRLAREQLREARANQQKRATLQQQVDTAARNIAKLAQAAEAARAAMAAELRAIGAADRDTAERLLAHSAERARHRANQQDMQAHLLEDGDGLTLETLRAEVAAVPPDEVEPSLRAARAAAEAAQAAAEQAAVALADKIRVLGEREQDEAYATAINARNAAATRAGRVLQEAAAARLAAAMLEQAMKAVEQQGGSEKLRRIGAWFATLTGGAYSRITSVEEGGRNLLSILPADRPDEAKKVEELSEGTRDQLFLALRLEAIEHHPDRLPFIADDILQSFDDERARAALHALLRLSEQVQVIVLTHHRHILDLAAALPEGSVRQCSLAA